MIGLRLNTFNDNSGEPEQDANSALTELDKGKTNLNHFSKHRFILNELTLQYF